LNLHRNPVQEVTAVLIDRKFHVLFFILSINQTIWRYFMKTLATVIALSVLLCTTPVMAGSGHDHGYSQAQKAVSSKQAGSLAVKKVKELADAGKIDSSWSGLKVSTIEQKTFSHDPEWVVMFVNDKIAETEKQKLYVFLTLSGSYIATNYTGN
jgi:uncharacterized protein YdeI (BOF family)